MTLPEDTILEERYRIDRLLAHGGMGAIYRGFDQNLNMPVAIKENFFQTPQSIHQFQQEALILARLRHPGLPRVIHHFSFEGQQYLVMDYIEGEDLWEIVKQHGRPLSEAQALAYIMQVCDAVSYLHKQNPPIIHRDIKPQNIKITPDNEAVLVDFGIAKIAEADGGRTRTGAQAVTPGFSPPEQYSGLGTTSVSDVYSLGATLYAILTAQKPPDSISLMVSKMKFQPANVVNTALSEAVAQAITHAMEPQTEARPQSVVAWKQELQHAQAGVPLLVVAEAEDEDEQETMLPGTVMAPGGIAANFADFDLLAEEEETPYWLIDTQKLGYQVGAEPLVIGRHSEADIIVRDKSISRRHTMVKVEEGQCVVRDNDSANGTFLNGERLDSGWQPLKAGDVLTIGSAQFTLSSTPPATLAPPKSTAAPIITSQDEVATSFDPVQQERAKVDPAPTPPPIAVWDTPAPAPPAQSLPDSKPVAVWDLPASSPTTPPPVIPAATQKNNMPLIIGAVVLLAVLGAVAFFLFSGDDTPTTPPTEPEVAEASEQNGGQNETIVGVTETETAEAVVSEELAATAESEATQAAEETATAAATGEAATAEAAEEVITEPEPATEEPIAEEPTPEAPTSIPTEASTATPEPDTPTPPPTVTNPPAQSSPPTNTPAPVVSGPTAIPLQSEESLQQIGGREVIDVDINPRNANEVYVLVKADGVYKSSTGGIPPWAKMPINGSGMTAFTIDPANSARFYGPSWNAVLKTEDGGNTWKAYGEGLSTANRSVDLVTVDPVNPNLLYGGIGATLVVSTDGGTTWISDGYGTGLGEGKLTSIVIDPFNNNTVFVGGEFGSLYRSVDSGRNFLQLAFNTGRGVYGMAAHPTQKDVYLVGLNSYDAGIMKTENGADFISSSNGLVFGGADSAYSAIVYAPSNPNIVYAGSGYESDADAKGIFKSTDGGKSWNRISDGLSTNPTTGQPHYVKAIAVHPTNPNTVFAATGGGLYQTTNGGDTWVLK